MVIAFPNLGNVALAMQALCQGLQIPYILPEPNNKETLQLGAYYAPEEICLPFKLILGNFIQGIRKGADTVLITGSCGPCRFGEFCEMLMKILGAMGYRNLNYVVVDLPAGIGVKEFMNRIGKISQASSVCTGEKIKAMLAAFRVICLSDHIDAMAYDLAGYEVNRGTSRRLLHECRMKAFSCRRSEEMVGLLHTYKKKMESIPVDPGKNPLKIAIIGELFTIIDPFSNFSIEERLMDYDVSTKRIMTPSWWVKDAMMKPLKLNSRPIQKAAREYLPYPVGGHGRECVGTAVLAGRQGMDGAIQIFPMGCMPQIIAKSVLPSVQRDTELPVMTLIMDEVAGEAGYLTRIEAFVDMLESRKRLRQSFCS